MYVRNVVGKQPGENLENFSNYLLKCCTVYIHKKSNAAFEGYDDIF